jgi:hypothetical protein
VGALYSEFFPTGSTSGHPPAPPSQNAPAHDQAYSRALRLQRSHGLFPASGSFYPRHAICYCQPKPRRRVPCLQATLIPRASACGLSPGLHSAGPLGRTDYLPEGIDLISQPWALFSRPVGPDGSPAGRHRPDVSALGSTLPARWAGRIHWPEVNVQHFHDLPTRPNGPAESSPGLRPQADALGKHIAPPCGLKGRESLA